MCIKIHLLNHFKWCEIWNKFVWIEYSHIWLICVPFMGSSLNLCEFLWSAKLVYFLSLLWSTTVLKCRREILHRRFFHICQQFSLAKFTIIKFFDNQMSKVTSVCKLIHKALQCTLNWFFSSMNRQNTYLGSLIEKLRLLIDYLT